MTKVALFLGSASLQSLYFVDAHQSENPGVGGTDWTTVSLARRLAGAAELETMLVTLKDVERSSIAGIPVVPLEQLGASAQKEMAAIMPAAIARQIAAPMAFRSTIVTLHHPHNTDGIRVSTRLRPACFVSVGQYAWHSNPVRDVPHFWIPNAFPTWAIAERRVAVPAHEVLPQAPTFGFVGALHPAKGFHIIAQQWRAIRKVLPNARLRVVGAGSLYGQEDDHPVIPTNRAYGDEIMRALGSDLHSVEFLGRLSANKLAEFSGWHVGLLNPTGKSEADPSSLKEVIAAGVPVVASDDFGMWDMMRWFPENVAKRPTDIAKLAVRMATDDVARQTFASRRSLALNAALTVDQQLEDAWLSLLASEGGSQESLPGRNQPTRLRPGPLSGRIRRRMRIRRFAHAVLGR